MPNTGLPPLFHFSLQRANLRFLGSGGGHRGFFPLDDYAILRAWSLRETLNIAARDGDPERLLQENGW